MVESKEKLSKAKSPFAKATGDERIVCHNCGQEIKPGEPKKSEDGTFVHQYEKGEGPRSEICEFC